METEADNPLDKPAQSTESNTTGRFVLLHHRYPNDVSNGLASASASQIDHFDLMLESDGILRTWALDGFATSGKTIGATPLPDHRIEYLEYEGEISGNRGTVKRVGQGRYETLSLPDNTLLVRLNFEDELIELEIRSESNLTTIHVR